VENAAFAARKKADTPSGTQMASGKQLAGCVSSPRTLGRHNQNALQWVVHLRIQMTRIPTSQQRNPEGWLRRRIGQKLANSKGKYLMKKSTIEEILDQIVGSIPPVVNAGWVRKQDVGNLKIYELRIPKEDTNER
jgi:hypothetical protein